MPVKFEVTKRPEWLLTLQDLLGYTWISHLIEDEKASWRAQRSLAHTFFCDFTMEIRDFLQRC